jgi:N-acetylglutamate synthase-like GNAT family acetyltransferase
MLHTDPKQEGRGAGSALLKWGIQKSDELGLPAYLESSPDAHGFYKKYGFEDVEIFELDLSRFGGPKKMHTAPLMTRQPVNKS